MLHFFFISLWQFLFNSSSHDISDKPDPNKLMCYSNNWFLLFALYSKIFLILHINGVIMTIRWFNIWQGQFNRIATYFGDSATKLRLICRHQCPADQYFSHGFTHCLNSFNLQLIRWVHIKLPRPVQFHMYWVATVLCHFVWLQFLL